MATMLIGYARCSTGNQDLTAQRDALTALGVKPNRIYVDHGLTGRNRDRPGLREALAACRAGDTLVRSAHPDVDHWVQFDLVRRRAGHIVLLIEEAEPLDVNLLVEVVPAG